jgi:hypothetical protein
MPFTQYRIEELLHPRAYLLTDKLLFVGSLPPPGRDPLVFYLFESLEVREGVS